MQNTTNSPAPKGISTVCVYLVINNIEDEIKFLTEVFNAETIEFFNQPNGEIMHATVRIGDTSIMMGKAMDKYPARESVNYIYVTNVDDTYKLALSKGAKSIAEPTDQFYGNRDAGIIDTQGNIWWVAQFLRDVSKEEIEKLFAEMMNK